jgi:hypothetical protein
VATTYSRQNIVTIIICMQNIIAIINFLLLFNYLQFNYINYIIDN